MSQDVTSQHGDSFAITAPAVFDGELLRSGYCVVVRDGTVAAVLPIAGCPAEVPLTELPDGLLAPGFIDLQVNGGGGAYLSFGTALAWPNQPATSTWAFYPSRDAVVAKVSNSTPWWKRPAWLWTREFGAWPASAEWLSAMFDYNTAPFFQSFILVQVEADRVRLRPYGVHGRLRWKDLDLSGPAASSEDFVEWTVAAPGR